MKSHGRLRYKYHSSGTDKSTKSFYRSRRWRKTTIVTILTEWSYYVTRLVVIVFATILATYNFYQSSERMIDRLENFLGIPLWSNRLVLDSFLSSNNGLLRKEGIINETNERPYAIFYNVYIPLNNKTSAAIAFGIVQEQMQQVAHSTAVQFPVVLYYNVIGDPEPLLKDDTMSKMCRSLHHNLECKVMEVFESGSEIVTLQRMLDFCIDHPTHRVSYIHAKGSFHNNVKNKHWRRALTDAALSPECITPLDDRCNLCGIQFFTQFTLFIPGNMFTAHCGYVRKLLPFDIYPTRREEAVMNLLVMRLRNQLKSSLIWDQRDFYGLDRYSDEHWIASHPDVVPCDMDPIGSLGNVFLGVTTKKDFSWAMGPRNMGICGGISDKLQEHLYTTPNLRQREILLLPGNLVKWFTLYDQTPPDGSWPWTHFPDGIMWNQAVAAHGSNAVDIATRKYAISLDGTTIRTSFVPVEQFNTTFTFMSGDDLDFDDSKRAIFYHIAIPEGYDAQDAKNIIDEQLKIVNKSYAVTSLNRVHLYYMVAGRDTSNERSKQTVAMQVESFCNQSTIINCIQLPSVRRNYEGETIRRLYQYCGANPTHRVSYIHNQGPIQLRLSGHNHYLILHMTLAVTSELCLNPPDETCNVCGLAFYMLWTLFFPGNMFAASCSYVNNLIYPAYFEERMTHYVKLALLKRIKVKFRTSLFSDRPDYFGLDRHAIDHWIGSHPLFKPCDVFGDSVFLTLLEKEPQTNVSTSVNAFSNYQRIQQSSYRSFMYWRSKKRSIRDFQWNLTPIRLEAPFDNNITGLKYILHNDTFLRREYCFLAGHILRWLHLYNDVPPSHSWLWKAFPEGSIWLKGYQDYGANVVDVLTEKYAVDGL